MYLTFEEAQKMMNEKGGNLDLRGSAVKVLPEGLTVGGSLFLQGSAVKVLPKNLTVGAVLV